VTPSVYINHRSHKRSHDRRQSRVGLALRVLAPLREIIFPQQSSRKGAKATEKNRKVRHHSFVNRFD